MLVREINTNMLNLGIKVYIDGLVKNFQFYSARTEVIEELKAKGGDFGIFKG